MPTTTVRLTLRHAPTSTHVVDYAVSEGEGPTVVLAPSALSPLTLWRPQLRRFGPRVRFLAWLPRGDGAVSLDDCVVALEREGIERFAVWGHGAGTAWAVRLAAEHGSVGLAVFGGLGVAASRAAAAALSVERVAERLAHRDDEGPQSGERRRSSSWSSRSLRLTASLMALGARRSRLLGRIAEPRDGMALAAAFLREPLPRTLRLLASSCTSDALPFAHAVEGPALVMTGRADPLVDPAAIQQLARRLPRSTVHVVADAGHLLPRELPDLVGLELERWLAETFPAGTR